MATKFGGDSSARSVRLVMQSKDLSNTPDRFEESRWTYVKEVFYSTLANASMTRMNVNSKELDNKGIDTDKMDSETSLNLGIPGYIALFVVLGTVLGGIIFLGINCLRGERSPTQPAAAENGAQAAAAGAENLAPPAEDPAGNQGAQPASAQAPRQQVVGDVVPAA